MMRLAILAVSALFLGTVSAQAQSLFEGWDGGQVTLYGWIPGITGDQEFPDGEPIVDLDSVGVLDILDFAFFVWEDPAFDPVLPAFYYARVLEIPTPRWTAYDAKYYALDDVDPATPMETQERAYTSPIWYTPG